MLAVRLTETDYSELLQQHTELLIQIDKVWIALVASAFVGLMFILLMMFAAAWSVRTVNKRQSNSEEQIREINSKFTLLIDILLEDAKRRRAGT